MIGWIFGSFTKKIERSANKVSENFVKVTGKELRQLAEEWDYIAQRRVKETIVEAENLENKILGDIEYLLNHADVKLRQQLEEVDRIRQETLNDFDELISETDSYLENRINQISLIVMEALTGVNATLSTVEKLEDKFFRDANEIVDKLDEVLIRTHAGIDGLFKKVASIVPNPFDPCRIKLKLGFKMGAMLSDVELYRLAECYEISKLNENTPIDEVLQIYGQLQLNAVRFAALAKNAPELKRIAIHDWLKYGIFCEFWRDTMKSYNFNDPALLEVETQLRRLTD